MEHPQAGAFWDAIRSWADSAGLLVPQPTQGDPPRPVRPPVPDSVCAACPICQAAATLDQVNPQLLADLTVVVRSVVEGLATALAAAADHRASAQRQEEPATGEGSADDGQARAPRGHQDG